MSGPKLPVTLSAVDRQAQLVREGKLPPSAEMPEARQAVSAEEIRSRLLASKGTDRTNAVVTRGLLANPLPNGAAGLKPDDEYDGSQMTLHPSQIKQYDRNPRRTRNPKYEEIKESIRVMGVLNPITVTRRPGTSAYMVYGGGNTRVSICQELTAEVPDDPRYSGMQVTYRAWRGEAGVIAAHAVENEARGDTTFWDKAYILVALKKELELESGTTLTSNDVRMKAAPLGWKVSRETVQLYDFATEWLAPVGQWLTFNVTKVLKDRFSSLSTAMSRLDVNGGVGAFKAVLSEELALQASRLSAASDSQGLGSQAPEVDATLVCNALDERVAQAIGSSVPELRQMLSILATNAHISAAQLRSEAAKGVVVARSAAPAVAATPTAAASPADQAVVPQPTQTLLPTPMLAAVRPASLPSGQVLTSTNGDTGLPSLENQGDLPPELAADASPSPRADAPPSMDAKRAAAIGLLDAMSQLAARTFNSDLFCVTPAMPLGYFMELPHGSLQPLPNEAMPDDQQIRLRRAGWQLLATLSSQFDHRACNERFLPAQSRWLQVIRSGNLPNVLAGCGIAVSQGGEVLLDAECLFYVLTEPQLLSPAVIQILSALAVRRSTLPQVLPQRLELVTRAPALAA